MAALLALLLPTLRRPESEFDVPSVGRHLSSGRLPDTLYLLMNFLLIPSARTTQQGLGTIQPAISTIHTSQIHTLASAFLPVIQPPLALLAPVIHTRPSHVALPTVQALVGLPPQVLRQLRQLPRVLLLLQLGRHSAGAGAVVDLVPPRLDAAGVRAADGRRLGLAAADEIVLAEHGAGGWDGSSHRISHVAEGEEGRRGFSSGAFVAFVETDGEGEGLGLGLGRERGLVVHLSQVRFGSGLKFGGPMGAAWWDDAQCG